VATAGFAGVKLSSPDPLGFLKLKVTGFKDAEPENRL
jgi:hypothetical protein